MRTDSLCCFDWDRVSGDDPVCSKNGVVLVHHEVGYIVNLPGLLDHLMSYEIGAKKR